VTTVVALIVVLVISLIGIPALLFFICTVFERPRVRWVAFSSLLRIWLAAIPAPLIAALASHYFQPPKAITAIPRAD
jgi:hypothetical protein